MLGAALYKLSFPQLNRLQHPGAPVPHPQWLAPSSLWVLSLTKLLPYLSCEEKQHLADLVLVNFPFPHLFHAMGCCGIHPESQWLTGGDPDGDICITVPNQHWGTQNKVDCHRYSQSSIFWSHSFYPDLYISSPQMQALPQLGLLWISSLPYTLCPPPLTERRNCKTRYPWNVAICSCIEAWNLTVMLWEWSVRVNQSEDRGALRSNCKGLAGEWNRPEFKFCLCHWTTWGKSFNFWTLGSPPQSEGQSAPARVLTEQGKGIRKQWLTLIVCCYSH